MIHCLKTLMLPTVPWAPISNLVTTLLSLHDALVPALLSPYSSGRVIAWPLPRVPVLGYTSIHLKRGERPTHIGPVDYSCLDYELSSGRVCVAYCTRIIHSVILRISPHWHTPCTVNIFLLAISVTVTHRNLSNSSGIAVTSSSSVDACLAIRFLGYTAYTPSLDWCSYAVYKAFGGVILAFNNLLSSDALR